MWRIRTGGGLALVLALGGAAAHAGWPALEIRWSVNGGPVNTIVPGASDFGSGSFFYDGHATDPATGLVLDYSLSGDPHSWLEGNVNIFNALDGPITVAVDVVFDFHLNVPVESALSGYGVVGLGAGFGGGMITSVPPWLWQTLIDEAPAGQGSSLFFHPFEMGMSGPGSAAAYNDFGVPEPVAGPAISQSIGFRIRFTLTDQDLASISGGVSVLNCPGDLNGNGAVGSGDLALLLAGWGPCPGGPELCPADLDGDGEVATGDLLLLLAAWGPC